MFPQNESDSHLPRLKADLALLAAAIIWGTAFVVQRVAALESGVFYFNGLRFLLGALALAPLAWRSRRSTGYTLNGRASMGWMLLAGLLLFTAGTFQQGGLRYTTAGNAGFITGLYVVFIPLLTALLWKQPSRPVIWIAALLSAAGMFLLSVTNSFTLNPGDLLELIGALFFALHVMLIGWLANRVNILLLSAVQYTLCGLASLGVAPLMEPQGWSSLAGAWWTIAYTGILSIAVGYTLQAYGQRLAPAADAAILLSLEAAFGAVFGWLFLKEILGAQQLLGCGLMFAGMLLAQAPQFK